jgi:hypothetical protein
MSDALPLSYSGRYTRRRESNPQPPDPEKEPRPAQQAEPISEEIASAMEPVERVELSDS